MPEKNNVCARKRERGVELANLEIKNTRRLQKLGTIKNDARERELCDLEQTNVNECVVGGSLLFQP